MKAFFALPVFLAATVIASSQSQLLNGSFALQGAAPKTEGHLKATSVGGNPLHQQLDFWMTDPGQTTPIKSYQVEMTKKLHVVIVSSDFRIFMHVHPALAPSGHLVLTQQFPAPGHYFIYADGLPKDLNHQVFRFDLPIGKGAEGQRNLQPTGMGVKIGPYEVDLSTVRLHAGTMSMIDVEILRDGKPAQDLNPYLGVPAHAVFLNSGDLSYVHTHPMPMDQMDMSVEPPPMPENAKSPSEMMLHVGIREPGSYRLWLQFRGGGQLYVAEFTLSAV